MDFCDVCQKKLGSNLLTDGQYRIVSLHHKTMRSVRPYSMNGGVSVDTAMARALAPRARATLEITAGEPSSWGIGLSCHTSERLGNVPCTLLVSNHMLVCLCCKATYSTVGSRKSELVRLRLHTSEGPGKGATSSRPPRSEPFLPQAHPTPQG